VEGARLRERLSRPHESSWRRESTTAPAKRRLRLNARVAVEALEQRRPTAKRQGAFSGKDREPIRKGAGLADLNFNALRHTAGNPLPTFGPCVPSKCPVPFEVLAATLNG
jgi:hypothetical protein